MGKSLMHYSEWLKHDGKRVTIGGRAAILKVSTYRAIYPYRQDMIDVQAVPVNRASSHYREIRAMLGDDWSTDVLDSDLDVQCEILAQLD